jgi:hypothetical protein
VEWPSSIEQFNLPFPERKNFDGEILKVMGMKEEEINEVLPSIYSAIADELFTLKRAMGSQVEEPEDLQLKLTT